MVYLGRQSSLLQLNNAAQDDVSLGEDKTATVSELKVSELATAAGVGNGP